MDAEQENIDYNSGGWQLYKPQKVKLRGSQQSDKQHKHAYSWVNNNKILTFLSEANFETVYQML